MKKIFFLYVLLSCMAVFGQEVITAEDLQEDRFVISDNDRIRISEFLFDITGQTQPYAITKNLDLTEQPEYYTPSEFEFYLKDLNQQLKNLRVMVDTDITVEYERTETGFIDARVTIHGRDTWNILVLPGPKYNSNTGISLKLKYKDENFLGSLEPFYVDFVFARLQYFFKAVRYYDFRLVYERRKIIFYFTTHKIIFCHCWFVNNDI